MDFNELKRKAAEKASIIADKSMVLAKKAADKTKDVAKITKLKAEIAGEREKMRANYLELGKKYYELCKDAPEDSVAQIVSEITVSLEVISAKQAEIEEIKANDPEADEEAEVSEEDFADVE